MRRADEASAAPSRWRSRRARRLIALSGASVAAMAVVVMAVGQSASGWDLSTRTTSPGMPASGGSYAVVGAFGEPLTGTSSGGSYSVSSGFFGGAMEKLKRFLPLLANDGSS